MLIFEQLGEFEIFHCIVRRNWKERGEYEGRFI